MNKNEVTKGAEFVTLSKDDVIFQPDETTDSKGILQGTTLWFDTSKGYGFIQSYDGESYFVHHSNINMEGFRRLVAGDIVEFETSFRDGAVNVNVILSVKKIRARLRKRGYELSGLKVPTHNLGNSIVYNEGWMITENGIIQSGETPITLEEAAEWIEGE